MQHNNYPLSLLQYPGGKSRAVQYVLPYIPEDVTSLCSPFLGGGSVELACTVRMNVHGYDIFGPLVVFWQVLLEQPYALASAAEQYYPLSRDKFYEMQKNFDGLESPLEQAAVFYVLNRASFSGLTLSGGMSPGHKRFTRSAIRRARNFRVNNLDVHHADFRDSMARCQNDFLYLDPPYMIDQALYGVKGNAHKDFDHGALAGLLSTRKRWLLSYNDCAAIRDLYRDYRITQACWTYGMSKDKRSSEVLILSPDIPLLPQQLSLL